MMHHKQGKSSPSLAKKVDISIIQDTTVFFFILFVRPKSKMTRPFSPLVCDGEE